MKFRSVFSMAIIWNVFFATGCSAGPFLSKRMVATDGRIYAFESDGNGFNTKSFFYDNGEEVVVFDGQFTSEIAQKSVEFIRSKTRNPITYVVLTHPNPDKFNGMSVFQALGAKVVASNKTADAMPGVHAYKKYFFVNMAKMFTDETYPKLSQVDVTFVGDYELRLANGETISLHELEQPGVSSNQTIASIPSLRAVVVGDLVHHNAHAWLEGGIVNGKPIPTLDGWIADLNELQALFRDEPLTLVYGGRGEAARLATAVNAQIRYLKRANSIVDAYIEKLGVKKNELQGEQAPAHYKNLQTEFEKVFPSYRLGYLIQYGVYGLVNSKL